MKITVRSVVYGVLGGVFLLVAGLGGWLATSLPWQWPVIETRIAAPGLQKPVRVFMEENAVPRISAETTADAYFALGYVHARDRFWQMESMRRFGAGRLAEVLGEPAVASDKWMRTLGLYRLAQQSVDALPDPVVEALAAYAKGVNHWLRTDVGLPALEFAWLQYTPEPWKPADSLVWGKIMGMRLGRNWRDEALRALIAKRIGAEKVNELWPAYPDDAPITIAGAASPAVVAAGVEGLPAWPFGPETAPKGASNVWAVGPTRTDTGGAILANDPHLGFQAPVLWYLARIESPELKLAGATVPGVPFHILGQNAQVAWGVTSTESDVADLFVEKLVDADPTQYVTPDGPKPFALREEVIKVKNAPDLRLTVRTSAHGPVISDLRPALKPIIDDGYVISLAATYLQPGDLSSAAFHDINRAKDWVEFNRALSNFQGPQQNFAFADTAGNIGFLTAGWAPKRRQGHGYVPTNGWTGDTDWDGFLPFAELPKLYKPTDDLVVNANNRVVPPEFRHFLSFDWAPPYRAQRIRQMLDDEASRGLAGQIRIQRDSRSMMASDLLALMLECDPATPMAKKAHDMLAKWNGVMSRTRAEPLIFMAWLRALNKALYGDELGELTQRFLGARPLLVKSILTRRQAWCDDTATDGKETCREILTRALGAAVIELAAQYGDDPKAWNWGDAHRALFRHALFTHVPGLNSITDLSIASDGGNATVNRGAVRLGDAAAPYAHVHGAGYRAVYDLADRSRSRFIIATGQSGNPLSSHYRDMLKRWQSGRLLRTVPAKRVPLKSEGFVLAPKG